MPDATFPENTEVQTFLRGAGMAMKVKKGLRKLKSFQDVTNCAAKWTRESQVNASFETVPSCTNADVVVTITKTRKWFDERQRKLELYKEELKQLKEQCGGDTRGSDN
ncbi:hypothetical protein GN244_ATG16289 [Phytophthora infestans]|nr:hypothetical protein GN244_ATG16289 [Phytophthora infestans]KAF4131082.1 hypothetical protein GN958_ATG19717 [Phytophthora infestans]